MIRRYLIALAEVRNSSYTDMIERMRDGLAVD